MLWCVYFFVLSDIVLIMCVCVVRVSLLFFVVDSVCVCVVVGLCGVCLLLLLIWCVIL